MDNLIGGIDLSALYPTQAPAGAPAQAPASTGAMPGQSYMDQAGQMMDALEHQESGGRQFDSQGRVITSPKGALGRVQMMPTTAPEAAQYAGLPYDAERLRNDPAYNRALGQALLAHHLQTFGDQGQALAAYNAGAGATRNSIALAQKAGDPSAWINYLPAETRAYVPAIMGRLGIKPSTAAPAPAPASSAIADEFAGAPLSHSMATPGPTGMDYLKQFGTSAAEAAGSMVQAGGEAAAYIANKVTGTEDYVGKNPFAGAIKQDRDSMTDGGKAAMADSAITGDITDPSSLKGPQSLQGWLMFSAGALGSLAPAVLPMLGVAGKVAQLADAASAAQKVAQATGAASDIAKAADAAAAVKSAAAVATGTGAGVNGAMFGGQGAEAARQESDTQMSTMSHAQLMAIPTYAENFNQTGSDDQARKATSNKAAQLAGAAGAAFAAAAGAFNVNVLAKGLEAAPIAKSLGGGAGRAARAVITGAEGAAAGGGEMGAQLAGQNAGENYAMGQDVGKDITRNSGGAVGAGVLLGGAAGAARGVTSAPHPVAVDKAPVVDPAAPPAPAPNSPLANAANAGVAAKGPEAPVDPISQKVAAIQDQIKSGGLLQALRSGDSPVDTKTFLGDLATASSPSTPAHAREQAMTKLEFALGWAEQNPVTPTAMDSLPGATPGADRSAPTTPQMRQAGIDREAQLMAALQKATTPGDRDRIQQEIAQNRQMNLGQALPKADDAPAPGVDFTATDPGTEPGAAPTSAAPAGVDLAGQHVDTGDMALAPPPEAAPAGTVDLHTPGHGIDTDSLSLAPRDETTHPGVDLTGGPEPTTAPGAAPEKASHPTADPTVDDKFDTGNLSLTPRPDAREEANAAGMAAHEQGAKDRQAAADAKTQSDAADAARRASEPPHPDAVIAALKPAPFQRTAEQRATIARARATLSADHLALLDKAANQPFSITAEDKARLDGLRNPQADVAQQNVSHETSPAAPTPRGKRRATLDQLTAMGFDTVERHASSGEYFLRNSKSNALFKLDSAADAQLARASIKAHIDGRAGETEINPSKAKIEATNYKKGRIENLNGVKVAIENPAGSTRRGTAPDGTEWESKLAHHYGEIEGTKGADGDPVDVFIGPRPDSKKIFIVDQRNADGSFDEHKVMMGFTSEEAARKGYLDNYEKGWDGLQAITEMSPEQFREWVKSDAAKEPVAHLDADTVRVTDGGTTHELPVVDEAKLPESPARDGKKTRISKKQLGLLRRVAEAFGKEIMVYADPKGKVSADGFVKPDDNDTIYLNERSTISPLAVFGHELMHQLRSELPAAYDAIAKVVGERFKDKEGFRKYYGDEKLSEDKLLEELVSDLNGNLMSDQTFWHDVFAMVDKSEGDQAKGVIAKLAAFIFKMIDAAVAAFKGEDLFGSHKYVEDSKEVRAAFRDAMRAYAKEKGLTRTSMDAEVLREQTTLSRARVAEPEVEAPKDQTQTPAFKRWFGDSKVVDPNGRPLVVYHGSKSDISEFKSQRQIQRDSNDDRFGNEGIYFTDDHYIADTYGDGGAVYPVYLSVKSPLVVGDGSRFDPASLKGRIARLLSRESFDRAVASQALREDMGDSGTYISSKDRAELARLGYDGILSKSAHSGSGVWIILSPEQAKSAVGNDGSFDPASADITRSKSRQDPAIGNRTDVDKLPPGKPIPHSAAVGGLESSLDLARSKTYARGRDLKIDIQDRVLAAAKKAKVDLSEKTQATHMFLANMVARDAEFALRSNENAVGWYDSKVSRAIGALGVVHPEIETDPKSRLAFLWALAVTSNGMKVDKNFELAERAYSTWKETGKMPDNIGIGNAAKSINKGLDLFNTLGEKVGYDRLGKFMATEFPAGDIERMLGETVGGEWKGTPVQGAAVLGPKIGNGFFANLNGYFDSLTMDRWLMRTWGRMTGTLIDLDKKGIDGSRTKLAGAIGKLDDSERKVLSKLIGVKIGKTNTKAELDAIAIASQKASMKVDKREIMSSTDTMNRVRLDGNGHWKAMDGQKEAPQGPAERNWIRAVFHTALDDLKAGGKDMTMSDLQALLWYPERRLYDAAKSDEDVANGYEDDEAPDYANAAQSLAEGAGHPKEAVLAAMDKAEAAGTTKLEPLSDDEKAAMLKEFRAAPEQQTQLAYEVAPDPADTELLDKWNRLPDKERERITGVVRKAVLDDIVEATGVKIEKTVAATGGFAGQVNPNLISEYKPGKVSIDQARGLAAAIGMALDQDSVALVDSRAAHTNGMVRITLDKSADKHVAGIMAEIARVLPGIDAFTARGKNIDILNFTDEPTEAVHGKIRQVLEGMEGDAAAVTSYGESQSELVEKAEYESHLDGLRPGSGQEIRERIERARDRAREIISEEVRGPGEDASGPERAGAVELGAGAPGDADAAGLKSADDAPGGDVVKSPERATSTVRDALDKSPDRLEGLGSPAWQQWLKANAEKLGVSADPQLAELMHRLQMAPREKLTRAKLISLFDGPGDDGPGGGITKSKNRDFEETQPAVHQHDGVEPSPEDSSATEGWQAPGASKFDSMVYTMQDKMVDTSRVLEAIRGTGKEIKDDLDTALQQRLYHGRAAKRTEDFVNRELEPLVETMKHGGVTIPELDEYLHARHAPEANEVIRQRNPEMKDGGSGLTDQDAAAYMAELPDQKRQALEAAAAKVDDIIKESRKLLVDYQLESKDKVQGWDDMFEHYVPLMREDEGDQTGGSSSGTGQGFSIKGKEVKSRTGSTRKVVDILANIAMQRERVIVRGEKNRVAQSLVGLATENPNPGFWEAGRAPTNQVFNPKTGLVENQPDPLFKQRENAMVAKFADEKGEVHEHAVVFNENNARAMRMVKALKNLDAASLEGLIGASAKATRYFAAINTQYNPVFGIKNLVRDVQDAMVNLGSTELAGKQAEVAKMIWPAMRGIWGDLRAEKKGERGTTPWADLWEEFKNEGGQTGYRQLFATSADRAREIEKALDPTNWANSKLGKIFTAGGALKVPLAAAQRGWKWGFELLGDYNETLENGTRLAAYKAGLDAGMSRQRAAELAKNLTVDFNKKGQVAQQAGALYAFFNASVQGTARVASTLFTMEPGKPNTIRLSSIGKKVVYGGLLIGVMQALAMKAAGFSEEDPPQFVRDNNFIIPLWDKKFVSIPLPQGLRVLPAMGRQATEWALGGFKTPTKHAVNMMALIADSFSPIGSSTLLQTLSPTILDPIVAVQENKDFTGRPIAKTSSNKAIPGYTLTKDNATPWGKVIAEAINSLSGGSKYLSGSLSPTPDQIDYLLGTVSGGAGRVVAQFASSEEAFRHGEPVAPNKVPLVGTFYGDAHSQASEGTAFYANQDHLNEIKTQIAEMKKDHDFAGAARVRMENPDAYLVTAATHAESQIQKLKQQKSALVKAGAAREQVVAVESKITDVMARLNRQVDALNARKP